MALITLIDAQLAFGHVALLDHTDFSLETGRARRHYRPQRGGQVVYAQNLGGL